DLASIRVLDLGAGNGLVGEALAKAGVKTLVGVDILDAARRAVRRDRPGIYTDYLVGDMTDPTPEHKARLGSYCFNAMTCVAALGFGDIPARAFIECFNQVEPGGFIAFNIKEDFLDEANESGFAGLIRMMVEQDALDVQRRQSYTHRLSTSGAPLPYVAFVALKRGD
ncbi:unnamed protein product, partial [Phaeothamnion confervicola]